MRKCGKGKVIYYPQIGHLCKGLICWFATEPIWAEEESDEYEVRAGDGRIACAPTVGHSNGCMNFPWATQTVKKVWARFGASCCYPNWEGWAAGNSAPAARNCRRFLEDIKSDVTVPCWRAKEWGAPHPSSLPCRAPKGCIQACHTPGFWGQCLPEEK